MTIMHLAGSVREAEPVLERVWHDHHLASFTEDETSVLMLSICALERSREGLTGLFM